MSMRPLSDSERNDAALAVARVLFEHAAEIEQRFPNGTRFTPVLIDEASATLQVAIEQPASAATAGSLTLEPITRLAS